MLDAAFRDAGLARQVSIQVASSVAAVPLVRAGLGVALVDGLVDWADMAGVEMRPFRPRLAMSLTLATDSARPAPRLAQALIALLRASG